MLSLRCKYTSSMIGSRGKEKSSPGKNLDFMSSSGIESQPESAANGYTADRPDNDPENSISLVLTDVVMPGSFDGFELAERIRRRQLGIPVLFMTGAPQQESSNSDSPDSKKVLLQKPFGPDQLIAIVREHL